MSRAVPTVLGVLLLLVGAVWTLQGAGLLPGSVMTGSRFWLVVGVVCLVTGGVLLYRAVRRRTSG